MDCCSQSQALQKTGGQPCSPRCVRFATKGGNLINVKSAQKFFREPKEPSENIRHQRYLHETWNYYGNWLDEQSWDVWGTLTFRLPPSAVRAMSHFTRLVDNSICPDFPNFYYFACTEEGKLFGRVHLHFLAGGTFDLLSGAEAFILRIEDEWRPRFGLTYLRNFDPQKKATHYCAKYITKSLGEWQIGGNWP